MNCENCGSPVGPNDAERGTCMHCGAALAYMLRAAEKAEIVRRVVAQGNTVRIEGDRIEASSGESAGTGPTQPRVAPGKRLAWATSGVLTVSVVVSGVLAFRSPPSPTAHPREPTTAQPTVQPPPRIDPAIDAVPSTAPVAELANDEKKSPPAAAAHAPPRATVDRVVAAHRAQYQRCERDEIGRNPAAPRRYSVAITVGPQGTAEWIEVLSEASSEMKACIESVTRGLSLPKPAEGSARSIVTLSLADRS